MLRVGSDLLSKEGRVENNESGSTGSDGIDGPMFVSHLGEGLVRFLLLQLEQIPNHW